MPRVESHVSPGWRSTQTRVAQQDETASSLGLGESDVEGIPSLSGHRPGPSTAGRAGRKLGFSFARIDVRWASGRD